MEVCTLHFPGSPCQQASHCICWWEALTGYWKSGSEEKGFIYGFQFLTVSQVAMIVITEGTVLPKCHPMGGGGSTSAANPEMMAVVSLSAQWQVQAREPSPGALPSFRYHPSHFPPSTSPLPYFLSSITCITNSLGYISSNWEFPLWLSGNKPD